VFAGSGNGGLLVNAGRDVSWKSGESTAGSGGIERPGTICQPHVHT
jgi:hypothetical protein